MECSICYESGSGDDKKIVKKFCNTCHIPLCCECWYDKCRSYCPICDRDILNQPKDCVFCSGSFHLKDINVCCICNKRVCLECEDHGQHSCDRLLNMNDLPLIDVGDLHKTLVEAQEGFKKKNEYSVLGTLDIFDNAVLSQIVRHRYNKNPRYMLSWDFHEKDKELIKNITGQGVQVLDPFGTFKKGLLFFDSMLSLEDCIKRLVLGEE